jgi:hypothetical protein
LALDPLRRRDAGYMGIRSANATKKGPAAPVAQSGPLLEHDGASHPVLQISC